MTDKGWPIIQTHADDLDEQVAALTKRIDTALEWIELTFPYGGLSKLKSILKGEFTWDEK